MASSPWSPLLEVLGERLDEDLLPAVYAAASVPTEDIRAWLRESGLTHVDLATGLRPALAEIDDAAKTVVSSAKGRAATMGALGGLAGAVAIPPEILASLVQTLRLAQRLAVMYGLDPETDAGKLVLWRALAAAYEVELPTEGALGVKVRDLPTVMKSQLPATRQATAWLARQVVVRTVMGAATRVTRLIPGLGSGIAAWSAHRRMDGMGTRMIEVYRRHADLGTFDVEDEEIAVEVG